MPCNLPDLMGRPNGLDPKKFPGVVDDSQAVFKGKWIRGQGLKPYFSFGYQYSSDPESIATFTWKLQRLANMILELHISPTQTGKIRFSGSHHRR